MYDECKNLHHRLSITLSVIPGVGLLCNQVKLLQDGQELAIKNAELMAQQGVQDKLLTRYMQGLRDGASLSAGQGMSPPVNAPPWSGA